MENTYDIYKITVKKVNHGLVDENGLCGDIVEEYGICLSPKDKSDNKKAQYINFVYRPSNQTFSDTTESYEEVFCNDHGVCKSMNLYLSLRVTKNASLFKSLGDYINYNGNVDKMTIIDFENAWKNRNKYEIPYISLK